MRNKKLFLVLLIFALLPLCAHAASTLSMDVTMGYNDTITYGKAIPVTITVRNTGKDVSGTLVLDVYASKQAYNRYEIPIMLAEGAEKRVTMPVNLALVQNSFTVKLMSGDTVLCTVEKTGLKTASPSAMLVGVLSSVPQNLSYLTIDRDTDELLRGEYWQAISLTADNFPDNIQLMRSFGMLVVDDFDVRLLSDAQKATLDAWLKAGGLVIVGGGTQASITYPFFAEYTGLTAGSVAQHEDITATLMSYLAWAGSDLNQPLMLNAATGGTPLLSAADDAPLIYMQSAGSGAVISATFELGAKPLTTWTGIHSLWQRVLIQAAPNSYQRALSPYWSETVGSYLADQMLIENDSNLGLTITILVLYLIFGGVGSYFILKRLDKREWMWATLPALACLCAVTLYFVGGQSTMNQPLAATVSMYSVGKGGKATYSSVTGITAPNLEGSLITAEGDGLSLMSSNYYDSYYDSETVTPPISQLQLNYRYQMGEQKGVILPHMTPWSVVYMRPYATETLQGAITGEIWMEEDGLHAHIVNETAYTLKDAYLITSRGYVTLPTLAPGEATDAAILQPETPEWVQPKGYSAPVMAIRDGVLIEKETRYYEVVNAIVYPEQFEDSNYYQKLSTEESRQRDLRSSLMSAGAESMGSAESSMFYVAGFLDGAKTPAVLFNGKAVTRTATMTGISCHLTLLSKGKTGLLYYPSGTLPAYNVYMANNVPKRTEVTAETSYFEAVKSPTFAFALPTDVRIEGINISNPYTYGTFETLLYNWKTHGWDRITSVTITLTKEQAAPYLNENSEIFVQYSAAANGYSEVYTPVITVQGRND